MEWINMKEAPPLDDQEILFITDEDITDEKTGIALANSEIILLSETDISFDNVKYWFPVPPRPEE